MSPRPYAVDRHGGRDVLLASSLLGVERSNGAGLIASGVELQAARYAGRVCFGRRWQQCGRPAIRSHGIYECCLTIAFCARWCIGRRDAEIASGRRGAGWCRCASDAMFTAGIRRPEADLPGGRPARHAPIVSRREWFVRHSTRNTSLCAFRYFSAVDPKGREAIRSAGGDRRVQRASCLRAARTGRRERCRRCYRAEPAGAGQWSAPAVKNGVGDDEDTVQTC